jgi:sec-independent protein translocase protein TatA
MPVLAGIGPFGPWELALILLIVVLIFGVGRLPEVGGAVGKGIREFRKNTQDSGDDGSSNTMNSAAADSSTASESAPASQAFCTECGSANARDAKFCAQCGHAMTAGVS